MTLEAAKKALDKAKLALMSTPDTVFFITLCFSLKHKWDETIPTACTNGTEVRYNPGFFLGLKPEERVFLILHETLHVAYLHMLRLAARNAKKWNIAADFVINLQLVERGFKMPKGGLLDYQYAGMSTEQVYDKLPDRDLPEDFDIDLEEYSAEASELEEQVKDILVRAAIQSKQAGDAIGTIPGELELYINNLLNPKLPWNRILQKYLSSLNKSDYTFRKPNRRFFPKHHLPSLFNEKLMDLEVAVDISGSVSDYEFKTFVSEVASIFKMMKPDRITLVQFDTEIHSVNKLKSLNELLQVQFKGRGGTDIRPIIERANALKPKLLLVFSDGGFRFFDETTSVNTLWLIHNHPDFKAPFGKVIHYAIKEEA